jgi:hypothetical protein
MSVQSTQHLQPSVECRSAECRRQERRQRMGCGQVKAGHITAQLTLSGGGGCAGAAPQLGAQLCKQRFKRRIRGCGATTHCVPHATPNHSVQSSPHHITSDHIRSHHITSHHIPSPSPSHHHTPAHRITTDAGCGQRPHKPVPLALTPHHTAFALRSPLHCGRGGSGGGGGGGGGGCSRGGGGRGGAAL